MQAAMVGLDSVAKAFRPPDIMPDTTGMDAATAAQARYTAALEGSTRASDTAKKAAVDLAKDGLMTVQEAGMGMKNLLSANFTLEQSIELMKRAKDMSAFTRQGTLAFGEAIVGFTQGLKNNQSMMVDNVGLTKNLSVIMREAGYSAGSMGEAMGTASGRAALFNGIMKESTAQMGDAARLSGTYTGQVTRLRTAYNMMLATWGAAVVENAAVAKAIEFVANRIIGFNASASEQKNALNLVGDATLFVVQGMQALIEVFQNASRQYVLAKLYLTELQVAYYATGLAASKTALAVREGINAMSVDALTSDSAKSEQFMKLAAAQKAVEG
jgi:hypothetical protein